MSSPSSKKITPFGIIRDIFLLTVIGSILTFSFLGRDVDPVFKIIIVVVFVILCFCLLYYFGYKKKQIVTKVLVDHGSARWSDDEGLLKTGLSYTDKGLWVGDGWTTMQQGHIMTIAPARQGKGTCMIIPALLSEPTGSFVVTDPKGENACITARAQKQYGQKVYILDPWGEQEKIGAIHGIPTSGFNPFDFIKKDEDELLDNCTQIANFLVPEKTDVKDPFWSDKARNMIKIFLLHIITAYVDEDHNFWTLYKMLRLSGQEWITLLLKMKANDSFDGLISSAAGEYSGFESTNATLNSIKSSAQNATVIFESPQLRKSLEKSEFDPYELGNGNCTVYIDIPERYIETHSAWLRLVIGLCLKACNARPKKPVYFLLDEFPIMGKMIDVQRGFAFAAGQNIVLWVFAQSLSQLKEIYGEDGMNTMISNAYIFHCFGVKDQYTTKYVSDMLGQATYQKESQTFNSGSGNNTGGSSVSYQTFGRSLMTPEEVEKFKHIITIVKGVKYQMFKVAYFENRYNQWDYKNDPKVTKEQRKKMDKGIFPIDWRETFQGLADPRPRFPNAV